MKSVFPLPGDMLPVLILALLIGCLIAAALNQPHLPTPATGLNPCGATAHCPTWNDNR